LVLPYTSWYFCSQNRTRVFCYCEMSKTPFLKIEHLCSVITNKFLTLHNNRTLLFFLWIKIEGIKRTSFVLLCTSWYFSVLLRTSWYFSVLLGTSSYFSVLLGTSRYFLVLLSTSQYFLVLLSTSWYFSVLLRTFVLQKYRSPLVPP
jgi:hypothetical protein